MAAVDKKAEKKAEKKSKRKSNLIFAFLMTLIIAVMVSVLCIQAQQKVALDDKIQGIQAQIDEANAEQENLKEQIEYQDSDEFVEKLARERLNLVKPNEIVFVDKNK